jgi:hypothetical protein
VQATKVAFFAAPRLRIQPLFRLGNQLAGADAKTAGDAGESLETGRTLVVFEESECLSQDVRASGEIIQCQLEGLAAAADDPGQGSDQRHFLQVQRRCPRPDSCNLTFRKDDPLKRSPASMSRAAAFVQQSFAKASFLWWNS